MKNFLKINSALVIAVLLLVAGCTKEKATSESGGYYCPMHPTVESATVGVCPVCNMELVAKNSQGSGEPLTADERSATESPTQRIFAQVKTIHGTYSAHDHILKAEGIVNYDTRSIRTVTTRLSGRIETLHAAAGFTRVKKGQVLATIYSQEALEAQRNFIESSKDPGSAVVVSAQQRLTLLGFSDELISKIRTGSILTTIPVVSPLDGYLLAGIPQAQPVREAERSMNSARQKTDMMSGSTSESKSITAGNTIRKGDFVSAGQDLFYLTEGNRVRLDLSIKESEFELLKPGQSIRGTTKNGDSFSGSIFLIEPDGSEQNAFRRARVYLNAFGLTIGSLVSVEISAGAEEGLWLPASSVLNLGTRSVVFLKNEDHFIPTAVITGAKVNDKVRIFKGLSSSDEVAAVATMLADSDGLIQSNDSPLSFISPADAKENSESGTSNAKALMMNDRTVELAGVQGIQVQKSTSQSTMEFNARITSDPAQREVVSTLVPGRIEKLFFRETGRSIQKNEIIAEIHSPEILTIIAELRLSLSKGVQGQPLVLANRNKLKRYGFTDSEIAAWERSEVMPETISIRSGRGGVITEVLTSPGKTVGEGSPLLTVENLATLWIEAEVYPEDARFVAEGKTVSVSIPGVRGATTTGRIEHMLPAYRDNSQITIARIRITNKEGNYRPGQIARVSLATQKRERILIPTDAVVADGRGSRVFVITGKNTFEPRSVKTGVTMDGKVEITEGLETGELIAGSGAYLLNSQFLLRQGTEHQH